MAVTSAALPPTLIPATLETDLDAASTDDGQSKRGVPTFVLQSLSDDAAPGSSCVTFTPATDVAIGREPACQLAFPDCHQISRLHCKIFSMGTDVFIEDRSSNGTFVNNLNVGKNNKRLLRDGDVVAVLNPKMPESIKYSWRFSSPVCGTKSDVAADPLREKYEIGRVLGTGNFATVYLGIEKGTRKQVAVKVIEKKRFALAQDQFSFDGLVAEVDILRKMNHENIIGIHDVFDDKNKFTMVLELVPNGDLFDYIVGRCPKPFTEAEAKILFLQLLEALLYMHSKAVAHRDLKPENILVRVDPKFVIPMRSEDNQQNARAIPVGQVTLKITDFGLAKFCGEHSVMTTMCGTPSYLAPEVLKPTPQPSGTPQPGGYSRAVDVWSLGIILYIMLSGCPPKDAQSGNVTFNKYFDDVSGPAKDLIQQMLRVDPRERADLASICAHAWLRGCDIKLRHLAVAHQDRLVLSGTVMMAPATTVPVLPITTVVDDQQRQPGPATPTSSIRKTMSGSAASATTTSAVSGNCGTDVDDGDSEATISVAKVVKRDRDDQPVPPGPVPQRAVWLWKKSLHLSNDDPKAWQRYSDADCHHIERSHVRGARTCKVGATAEYRVSFEGMFQYNTIDTTKQRPVKRILE